MPRANRNIFRVNAKQFLLTYPHCNDLDGLRTLFHETYANSRYFVIGRERHADGEPHLHSVIILQRRFDAGERSFDFNGYHANIQAVRNVNQAIEYVKKDGDYIEEGEDPSKRANNWRTIQQSETEEDFWRNVQELQPRDYITNLEKLQYYARFRYPIRQLPYETPDVQFDVPLEISNWVEENIRVSHISTNKSSY